MIFLLSIILYLVIGVFAGLAGALLGIGGGVITVPALLFVFSLMNFPEASVMHIAIATSLSAMVLNTLSSTYFHHVKRSVQWKYFLRLVPGIVIGSIAGALIAGSLPSHLLKVFFGFFACLIGFVFVKPIKATIEKHKLPSFPMFILIGTIIACLADLLGIGGGLFIVPILLYYQLTEKKAIGTAVASSCLISFLGALSYLFFLEKNIEIPGCFGSIYLPAFLAISVSGIVSSFYGVKLAHALSPKTLRKTFSAVMVAIGLLMIFT